MKTCGGGRGGEEERLEKHGEGMYAAMPETERNTVAAKDVAVDDDPSPGGLGTLYRWQEDPQAKTSCGEEVLTINVQDG